MRCAVCLQEGQEAQPEHLCSRFAAQQSAECAALRELVAIRQLMEQLLGRPLGSQAQAPAEQPPQPCAGAPEGWVRRRVQELNARQAAQASASTAAPLRRLSNKLRRPPASTREELVAQQGVSELWGGCLTML